jgi:hypothetical protein
LAHPGQLFLAVRDETGLNFAAQTFQCGRRYYTFRSTTNAEQNINTGVGQGGGNGSRNVTVTD